MPIPKALSPGEELFALHLTAYKIPFVREYEFCSGRKWRVDFALAEQMIAIEIEGGIWTNGRHSRGKGMEEDMRKYCELAIQGWRLMRFSTGMVQSGEAIDLLQRALGRE